MIHLFKPKIIIILLTCYVSIFIAQAQSKYEDPTYKKLDENGNFENAAKVARFLILKATSNEKKLYYSSCLLKASINSRNIDLIRLNLNSTLAMLPITNDSEVLFYSYYRIGKAYAYLNKNDSCIINYIKALDYKKTNLEYAKILKKIYNHLSEFSILISNDTQMEMHYLNLAYENSKIIGDSNYSSYLLSCIAFSKIRLGNIEEGKKILILANKNLSVNNTFININDKILFYQNMASVYTYLKEYKTSNNYLQKALAMSKENKVAYLEKSTYLYMANNFFEVKEYYKSIFYGLKVIDISQKNNFDSNNFSYLDSILFVSYAHIGDYEKAYEYLGNYSTAKVIELQTHNFKEINKLSFQFNKEKNEKKLAMYELEQTKDKATIQFLVLIIFISILIFLIIIGYKILENKRKKIIFKTIENSDNEINSIKSWLEWRNNYKTIANSNDQTAIIENDLNSATLELVNEHATNEPEISAESNDKINFNIETSNINYTNLYFELREVLETKQLYLNPELNLDDLIKVLGTNKKYLYYAIKSNYEDNFRSLLNDYRINHVKSLIVESINTHKKIRMEEIQESSGFQSTASFFRVFKSKTGLTPLEYAEQVKRKQQSVA